MPSEQKKRSTYGDTGQLAQLPLRLSAWFADHRRMLPWRENAAPYRVWVSEIMLQQTRIEAVIPHFEAFLSQFPDIPALAAAPDDAVMKAWQGLGYYSRARSLKKAAQVCVETYGGELPSTFEELSALPGIGPYTAGAVASIAFGRPVPAVDGNVLRVAARLCGSEADVMEERTKKDFFAMLSDVMRGPDFAMHPGAFNEALMELGETVCIPNGSPLCADCPLREDCIAWREGRQEDLPVRLGKKARRTEERTVFVISAGDRYLLHRRPETGLLAGLYEFPSADGTLGWEEAVRFVEDLLRGGEAKDLESAGEVCNKSSASADSGSASNRGHNRCSGAAAITEDQTDGFGCDLEQAFLGSAKHVFSHVEWHMTGWRVGLPESAAQAPLPDGYVWAGAREIREVYALPSAFRFFLQAIGA
ncbi:MAG: A/G-specific adenine glycosylase [Lachnospiraceae bacterium]|nr:A/G-specific adenine glycosylase [Lachnospiraceae bacterium]